MQELEENGGRGRYTQLKMMKQKETVAIEAVRVLSPPRNPIYGSAFKDVFGELKAYGVQVFISAHLKKLRARAGAITIIREGSIGPGAKLLVVFHPKGGNLVARHELQHVRDFAIDYAEFQTLLPEIPPAWHDLLEKIEAGEALNEREKKILNAAAKVFVALIEAKASEASLSSIFTVQGLREMADVHTWFWEVNTYFNELLNVTTNNIVLLYSLYQSGLSDSHSSNKSTIVLKIGFYSAVSIAIMLASLQIFVRSLDFLEDKLSAAWQASRRCSGMIRRLLHH